MGDDLLACVLGGVYTDVEKTLIELERGAIVRFTGPWSRRVGALRCLVAICLRVRRRG